MIRVKVSGNHSSYGLIVQDLGEEFFPCGFGIGHVHARVDDSPAVPVFQEPQVDMIKCHGQGKPQPMNARGDLFNPSILRRWLAAEGVT